MKMTSAHLLTLLLLTLAPACFGNTYWVSVNGQANWADARSATPLAGIAATSLQTASQNAGAGDTVYLRAGTYTGQDIRPRKSGASEEQRITFAAHADEQVVLSESEGIFILKQSYITVKGIEFRSMKTFFRIFGSHYIHIEHCVFDGRSKDADLWVGALICEDRVNRSPDPEDSTHNRVAHCKFFRWYWQADIRDRGAVFDIGIISSKTDKSGYNVIEHNEMAYGGHHPFGVFSKHNVIRNNYFHNETDPKEWNYPGYRGAISQGSSAGRNLWEGNRFGFCDHAGLCIRSPHNIIRKNYFYQNAQGGIQVVSNAQFANNKDAADHNRIYHNTFYHNGHRETYPPFQGGIYFANWREVSAKENVIKNNLFHDNKNGAVSMENRVLPQIVEHNSDNDSDPLFIDPEDEGPHVPTKPDLRLRKGSPAIDQGRGLTTITSADGTGRSFRVADASYFMDGWGIVQPDEIRLIGQENSATISEVDYASNTLTLTQELTFRRGQAVALTFRGNAPDLGAHELE